MGVSHFLIQTRAAGNTLRHQGSHHLGAKVVLLLSSLRVTREMEILDPIDGMNIILPTAAVTLESK